MSSTLQRRGLFCGVTILFALSLAALKYGGRAESTTQAVEAVELGKPSGTAPAMAESSTPEGAPQLVFVLGVEGVGHHGLMPVLQKLAALDTSRSVHVRELVDEMRYPKSPKMKKKMDSLMRRGSESARHLFVEDRSFPTSSFYPPRLQDLNPEWIKGNQPRYDIVQNVARWRILGVDVKLILMKRDFKRLVYSHQKWHKGIKGPTRNNVLPVASRHALVEAAYMEHISLELGRIDSGVESKGAEWRRLDYEWLAQPAKCPPLVGALVEYLGWEMPEDVGAFCDSLGYRTSTKVMDWSEQMTQFLDAMEADKREGGWSAYYREDKALISGLYSNLNQ